MTATEIPPTLDLVRIGNRREVINRGAPARQEYRQAADGSVCLVLKFRGGGRMCVEGAIEPDETHWNNSAPTPGMLGSTERRRRRCRGRDGGCG